MSKDRGASDSYTPDKKNLHGKIIHLQRRVSEFLCLFVAVDMEQVRDPQLMLMDVNNG